MTKSLIIRIATFLLALIITSTANAYDLKTALGKIATGAGKQRNTEQTTGTDEQNATTNQTDNKKDIGSVLGGLVGNGTLGGIVDKVISNNSNVTLANMVGTWTYTEPAVTLKGGDLLSSVGGAAASTAIEKKLATYYNKVGINKLQITINEDSTFTMTVKKVTLKGTIEMAEDNHMIFNFQAFGTMNIGKIDAMAGKGLNTLSLTFDMQRVIELAKKIATISKNSTFTSLAKTLDSYDGIYAGFKLAPAQ